MAETLNRCLDGRADLVFDPSPADVLRSPWRTYRRALEETPTDATHRLIVQDDVIVCDYFLTGVEAAIRARPDRMLFFFVPGTPVTYRRMMEDACEAGATWVEVQLHAPSAYVHKPIGPGWVPVVATLWPVALIGPCLAFDDGRRESGTWPTGFVADDEIVGRFLRETFQANPLACVPSLVEHPDTVPSIMNGHRGVGDGLDPGRRAAVWIGDYPDCYGCDARSLDFTVGAG